MNWDNLSFGYIKTNCNVRATYKDGVWGALELEQSEYINMHMSAATLHYGSQIFEGMKAYRGVDGKVRLFRPDENAKRFASSAEELCMPSVPEEMFVEACVKVVEANLEFVPPYESGATLYIRPMLIGTQPILGVAPAEEYLFCVFVSPVGVYFKGGLKPIDVMIDFEHDRAAPRGTGAAKCGGNYAASILSLREAREKGFANVLYLDAAEQKYIEECGAANFFGIKGDSYVTPESPSILKSITNKSICTLVEQLGLKVERRNIAIEELSTFEECGACGTAAVISPIGSVYNPKLDVRYSYGEKPGKYCVKLMEMLQDIQYGRAEDALGWCKVL